MGKTCSTQWIEQNCMQSLVGKPEGKRLLGRHGRKSKDNITRSSGKNE
jgi:hypothetical protein